MILENPQHERFALFVAGGLSPEEAYVQAGFNMSDAKADAHLSMKNQDVAMRIAEARIEMSKRTMAGIVSRRIVDTSARLKEWQQRWDDLRKMIATITAERGGQLGGLQYDAPPDAHGISQPYYLALAPLAGFSAKELYECGERVREARA